MSLLWEVENSISGGNKANTMSVVFTVGHVQIHGAVRDFKADMRTLAGRLMQ